MTDVYGIELKDAPAGWTALEVIVLVKAIDEEGRSAHFTRYSKGLDDFETVGMLVLAQRTQVDNIQKSFESDNEGDE